MGSRYLTDLADVCRRSGYPVIEVDGWQNRARGSGGYDSGRPNHVMAHHTASGASMDGWGDVNYMTFNHQDAPLCNLYLSRDGTIYVCAGGATNTNGSGHDPCGITSDDSMNSSAIGIEAGNNGVGEQWPDAQQDSYVLMCKALCDGYGISYTRIHAHFEWAPSRKIDPAGNSRYASGGNMWNMDQFRTDVSVGAGGGPGPGPSPEPTPPPSGTWPASLTNSLPTIKKGDSGIQVKKMQHLLAAHGYLNEANTANYDGAWGNGTDSAKARFDSDHGLASGDTDCGPKSWAALCGPMPNLKKGDSGAEVKKMQHLLAACGFMNEGNVSNYDGQWGNGTDSAKVKFDNASGLTPSPPTDCGQGSWTALMT